MEVLSKCYDPADLFPADITGPVEQRWDEGQHWSRRWEYCMALSALKVWQQGSTYSRWMIDVGGAGSPFSRMLSGYGDHVVTIVDPKRNVSLAEFVHEPINAHLAPCVFCISVIEHVEDLDQFLYHLSCLVAPGGLLFLTTDFWDRLGEPDTAHWHWDRKRIFDAYTLGRVAGSLLQLGFSHLGGAADYTWHGPIENWGYAPASLAMVRRS